MRCFLRGCDPDAYTCDIFLRALRDKVDPPQDGKEFLDEFVLRLGKRKRWVAASRILQFMLQKLLPPKARTWEIVLSHCCKQKKVVAAIEDCWNDLFH